MLSFFVNFVIMLDVLDTRLGETLKKVELLDEAQAWLEAITPSLEAKIVRNWIQEDQLYKQGVDEDGTIIGLYSVATEIISRGRKRAGTPFTLYDTGEFYRSMFITKLRDSVIIDADDEKMRDQVWYDDKILGLTDENLEKFIEEVRFGYAEYVRRILGIDLRNAFA